MNSFTIHTGVAAPLMRNNVDTDAIIPSREMKAVGKSGLAEGLFAPWRYSDEASRTINPEFVLNKADYQGASILLSGNNFGCGSSREHAVWALAEYGIKCIIAEDFGNIFFRNCVRNGILAIRLPREVLDQIVETVSADPQVNQLTVDLEQQLIKLSDKAITFECSVSDREMLLEGLDAIDMTLKLESEIQRFIDADSQRRPWLY